MNQLDENGLKVRAKFIEGLYDTMSTNEIIDLFDDHVARSFLNAFCQVIADQKK